MYLCHRLSSKHANNYVFHFQHSIHYWALQEHWYRMLQVYTIALPVYCTWLYYPYFLEIVFYSQPQKEAELCSKCHYGNGKKWLKECFSTNLFCKAYPSVNSGVSTLSFSFLAKVKFPIYFCTWNQTSRRFEGACHSDVTEAK